MTERELKNRNESDAARFLTEKNVPFEEIHSKYSELEPADIAKMHGMSISQMLKCVAGRDNLGNLHVVMVPETTNMKFRNVSKEANTKVHPLTTDELKKYGATLGVISPTMFASIEGVTFYIDTSLLEDGHVGMSSGDPKTGIVVNARDLARALKAKPCNMARKNGIQRRNE